MLRVGIISNPFAKINKLNPEYNTKLRQLLGNKGEFEITRSLEHLYQVCQEFSAKKVNLIGIVGGDGSIGLALSALWKAYDKSELPKILPLKGGTINFLASNLKIKKDAYESLNDTLQFINRNQDMNEAILTTLHVNGRLGFIFANGVASSFLEEYYKNKSNSFGAITKVAKLFADGLFFGKLSGKFFPVTKQTEMTVLTKPTPLTSILEPKNYSMIFASTVCSGPLKINIFKKVVHGGNYAEMIAISEKGLSLLKLAISSLVFRNIYSYSNTSSVTFQGALIKCPEKSYYSIDGDIILSENGNLNLEIGPKFIFCSPYKIS